jgi:hypothetical protein
MKHLAELSQPEVRARVAYSARGDAAPGLLTRFAAIHDQRGQLALPRSPGLPAATRSAEEETARRRFVLQYVPPGLAGLMDGSVSTLAP